MDELSWAKPLLVAVRPTVAALHLAAVLLGRRARVTDAHAVFVHHLALFAGVGAGLLGWRDGRRGREGDDEQDQGKESSGESPRVMFLHNVLLCREWRSR